MASGAVVGRLVLVVLAGLSWQACQAAQLAHRHTHRLKAEVSTHHHLRGGHSAKQHQHKSHSRRTSAEHGHKRSKLTALLQRRIRERGLSKHEVFMRARAQARMSFETALSNLPPKLVDLYAEFKKGPDATKGKAVLDTLNLIYKHAQGVQDTVGFECAEKNATLKIDVETAQADLEEVQRQLSQVQDRLHSLQTGMERSEAEIETLRSQFQEHRQLCAANTMSYSAALKNLTADVTLAKAIADEATSGCKGGGTPAELVECSMPDETIIATFKSPATREKVAKLSGQSERLLSQFLYETLQTAALEQGVPADDVLGESLLAVKKRHRTVRVAAALSGMVTLLGQEIPANLCTAARVPSCGSFVDSIESFFGSVQDSVDDLNARQWAEQNLCSESLESYTVSIRRLKDDVGNVGIALANGVAEQASLVALTRQRKTQFSDIKREVKQKLGTCTEQLQDAADTVCSAKNLWRKIKKETTDGKFLGACEVSDWVVGSCSAAVGPISKTYIGPVTFEPVPCGVSGTREVTRKIVSPGLTEADCPPLKLTQVCNQRPCPVDGQMGRWEEWSQCSRICGGGTRTRSRVILTLAGHGGLPTGETMQEELCNVQPCNLDCQLGEWTAWSNCSTACGHGHRLRTRYVLQDVVGQGTCPASDDITRRHTIDCNETGPACGESAFKCATHLDLLLVLDGSGSVTADDFTKMKDFSKKVLERVSMEGDQVDATKLMRRISKDPGVARAGAIVFGGGATIVSELTGTRSDVTGKLGSLAQPGVKAEGWSTSTAQGLAVARQLLQRQTDNPGADQVVLVVSNGAPTSGRMTSTEVDRLKESGVRIMFVDVGLGAGERATSIWASWPHVENIVRAPTYKDLDHPAKVADLLVKLCPVLVDV